jgi:hypothetical protein
MFMPIVLAFIFLLAHTCLLLKKRCIDGRKKDLNKHAHAMVSMNLVVMYFLYLYLTRNALDVFNCVPLDPPDAVHPDYTYMTAVGGVRCYQEGSLQMQLLPLAVLSLFIYTFGFPILLGVLFWRNKLRIQHDQTLRASGLGDKRNSMDVQNVYNVRKRYSALYYQFKPRCYYWTVVIIARKFAIAAINLMLRADVDYMLAASLLVMFVSFSAQLLNRPFMGPAEYKKVRETWSDRTASVAALPLSEKLKDNAGNKKRGDRSSLYESIRPNDKRSNETRDKSNGSGMRATMAVLRHGGTKNGKKFLQWLVNYNTGKFLISI